MASCGDGEHLRLTNVQKRSRVEILHKFLTSFVIPLFKPGHSTRLLKSWVPRAVSDYGFPFSNQNIQLAVTKLAVNSQHTEQYEIMSWDRSTSFWFSHHPMLSSVWNFLSFYLFKKLWQLSTCFCFSCHPMLSSVWNFLAFSFSKRFNYGSC